MHRHSFRIHHENDPHRAANRSVDSDEAFAALRRFRDALPSHLEALGASAEILPQPQPRQPSIRMTISTELDWEKTYLAMVGFAQRHGLRAIHVRMGLASTPSLAPLVQKARNRLCVLLRPGAATAAAGRRVFLA